MHYLSLESKGRHYNVNTKDWELKVVRLCQRTPCMRTYGVTVTEASEQKIA